MNIIERLSSMITVMNIISLSSYHFVPEYIKDIMRANSLIIFTMVLTFWSSGRIFQAYDEFVESLNIPSTSLLTRYIICIMIDVGIHLIPLIIVGLPNNISSLVISSLLISIWYVIFHRQFGNIYAPIVEKHIDDTMIITYIVILFFSFSKLAK